MEGGLQMGPVDRHQSMLYDGNAYTGNQKVTKYVRSF